MNNKQLKLEWNDLEYLWKSNVFFNGKLTVAVGQYNRWPQ